MKSDSKHVRAVPNSIFWKFSRVHIDGVIQNGVQVVLQKAKWPFLPNSFGISSYHMIYSGKGLIYLRFWLKWWQFWTMPLKPCLISKGTLDVVNMKIILNLPDIFDKMQNYLTDFKHVISPLEAFFSFYLIFIAKTWCPVGLLKKMDKLEFTYDVTYKSCNPIKEKRHAKYNFLI